MNVQVRQWSDRCFAVYVFDGDRYGSFVGTASTRVAARRLGEQKLLLRREALQRNVFVLPRFGGSVGECIRPDGTLATPAGPDRYKILTQQGERL